MAVNLSFVFAVTLSVSTMENPDGGILTNSATGAGAGGASSLRNVTTADISGFR